MDVLLAEGPSSYFGRAALNEAGPSSSLGSGRESLLCQEFRQRAHMPFLALSTAGTSTGEAALSLASNAGNPVTVQC